MICATLNEVMACFDAGTLLRHTGSTLMNEQSSRSHSVFTVSVGKHTNRELYICITSELAADQCVKDRVMVKILVKIRLRIRVMVSIRISI